MGVLNNKINVISNRNCYFSYHCSSRNYHEIFFNFILFLNIMKFLNIFIYLTALGLSCNMWVL